MRRREFIALTDGAATVWPLAARAQQRMRRIAMLLTQNEGDAEDEALGLAFIDGLHKLGWSPGSNVVIDHRLAGGDPERTRQAAVELVNLQPDVIWTTGGLTLLRSSVRPIASQSCFRRSTIRSVPGSSRACRGRTATSLASRRASSRWAARCSKR